MTRWLARVAILYLGLEQVVLSAPAATTTSYRPKFTVPADVDNGAPLIPNVDDPKAVNAQKVCPGYKASGVQKNSIGFTATLSLAGEACNVYGTDVDTLKLSVGYQDVHRLSVNIEPMYIGAKNYSYYILSPDLVPKPSAGASSGAASTDLKFTWGNSPSFWFSVTRKSTGDVLFSTKDHKLVYENQFIEFVSDLPRDYNLSGLGERIHALRLNQGLVATTFAADVGDPIDSNIYGSHPFYLDHRYFKKGDGYKGYSHGVFQRNAHGQEAVLSSDKITWRFLGGSVDLYFFDGPTPAEVTKQYQHGAIGLPAMQQYFTFGYHQCRWGYANWTQLEGVVETFKKFDIPLENIWTDIDYMDQYRDFSNDANTFSVPQGQKFLSRLHANNQHYIPIVDSAIYIPNPENKSDAYDVYTRGHKDDIFMKNPDGTEYIGDVWPGYTVFPDWHAPMAVPWWSNEMVTWHKDIAFDGIWIDMSEVSSFCVGSCGTGNLTMNPAHPPFSLPGEEGSVIYDFPEGFKKTNRSEALSASKASKSQASATATPPSTSSTSYLRSTVTPGVRNINYPPYVINNVQGDLAVHAVAPNATHSDGVVEYDVHNLFGHQILNATYSGLQAVFPGKRPFIIGRSTFAGTGKWSGHWGGDNYSKWLYMYFSIPQALSFSLFGIPMFGVDTCGFNDNTDEELCNRWMQLSAFFPFYRNHNTLSALPQEPYRWASVITATKAAMHIRYSILPYIYTLFYQAHITGSTVMRALSWEFPNDPSLVGADRQFLLGPGLMVTPVLNQGARSVKGVFPGTQPWYDWYTQKAVPDSYHGKNVTIAAPLGHIPVYIRGGHVLPTQQPGYTTTESRQNPWGVLVALDNSGCASGSLYVDDGESEVQSSTLNVAFQSSGGKLSAKIDGSYEMHGHPTPLSDITVMGVASAGKVTLNGKRLSSNMVHFDADNKVLKVTKLEQLTSAGAWKADWVLAWH